MRSSVIVEDHVAVDTLSQGSRIGILVEVDQFIFKGSEKAFDKNVVQGTTFAVHRYLDAMMFEQIHVILVCKVAALIGIDDFWFGLGKGSLQAIQYKTFLQGTGKLIVDHITTEDIDDDKQVHKAFAHPNIGQINCPHLIDPGYGQMSQQIRVNVLAVIQLAQVSLWIDGIQAHFPHESARFLESDRGGLIEFHTNSPISVIGVVCIDFIDLVHDHDIGQRSLRRLFVPLFIQTGSR